MDGLRDEDKADALKLLKELHGRTVLDEPDGLPEFHAEAAIWAACFFYRAVQLVLLRRLGDDEVLLQLADYPEEKTPAVIYSVDLSFRHLPGLFRLSRSLAPGDVLVQRLQGQALQWPLSAVGVEIDKALMANEPDPVLTVLAAPCLRQIMVDRIIQTKDRQRALDKRISPYVAACFGQYGPELWPGLKILDLHGTGQTDSGQDK
jgi:hypothetical protein